MSIGSRFSAGLCRGCAGSGRVFGFEVHDVFVKFVSQYGCRVREGAFYFVFDAFGRGVGFSTALVRRSFSFVDSVDVEVASVAFESARGHEGCLHFAFGSLPLGHFSVLLLFL